MSGKYHSAAEIVGHLGGRWNGKRARCRCPVTPHSSDKFPMAVSQTRDGRVLVFCHAGCDQRVVIAALQAGGLWGDGEITMDPSYPGYFTTRHDGNDSKEERKTQEYALSIWDRAFVGKDSPVHDYLRGRGIKLPVSDQLRYLPRLKHTPSGQTFRVMVGRIADARGFRGIQRTYIDNTHPVKANALDKDGEPYKMKLTLGAMGGGAVRLRMPGDVLGLAEGIETALSASQIYAMPVWATLSAHRLDKIEIPNCVRFLHIFGDSGTVGQREAFAAADHYERKGLHVEIVFPAAHFKTADKADFNSVITEQAARA